MPVDQVAAEANGILALPKVEQVQPIKDTPAEMAVRLEMILVAVEVALEPPEQSEQQPSAALEEPASVQQLREHL